MGRQLALQYNAKLAQHLNSEEAMVLEMLLAYPGIQVCNLVIKQPTWLLISSQLSRRFVDRQQRQRQEVHGSSPEIRARKNPLRDFSMVIVAAI